MTNDVDGWKVRPASWPETFAGAPEHGGDLWGAARRLGCDPREVLDLSASLNPLGPPPGLGEVLGEALELICHYPDRYNLELREALAGHLGVEPANILPGNGSTALIRLLARALDLKTILVLAPSFGEFPRALAIAGRHFHYHMLSDQDGFVPCEEDLAEMWEAEPSCLILTNPSTPAGAAWDRGVLEQLLHQARRRRCWVVMDEAFIDFVSADDAAWSPPLVQEDPRLLILRSLTKFYCLAGLRLGCLVGHSSTIAELAPLGEPWSVNTLAQRAGVYCLEQKDYAEQTRRVVARWREAQARSLKDLGLRVYPSRANYLLVELPDQGPSAARVAESCARQGVLLRDCANFPGCHDHHLRLAVAPPEDQDRLLEVLPAALQGD